MVITKVTKVLLTLIGVGFAALIGWYGWQYYVAKQDEARRQSTTQSASPPTTGGAKPTVTPLSPAEQDKLVNDVLEATGLTRQLEQLPEQIRAGLAITPDGEKIPPEVAQMLEKIVVDAFHEEKIHASLVTQLKAKFDQKRMRLLLHDFSTPWVKRIVAMETKTPTRADQEAYFQKLATKPLPASRVSALQRLDHAANVSEISAEIAMSSIQAMAGAMVGSKPAEREAFDREMEKQRGAMMENIRNGVMGGLAFTYRDASDADIGAYAKIYESDHAKWFTAIAMETLTQGIKNASKRSGERLASFLHSKDKARAKVKGAAPAVAAPSTKQMPKSEATPSTTSQPSAPPKARKRDGDIQKCLSLEDNRLIAKCTEQYR